MTRKIVDTLLPTTMVGSYPRPEWYKYQLLGKDVRVAFKHVGHAEAYEDATRAVIMDQQDAGIDIVTDGQMSYDDYVGVIGSFCWYMYERIPGFEAAKEPHPSEVGAAERTKEVELLSDWGGVINSGPVKHGPIRLADLFKIAQRNTTKPIKVSVGAGPVNLAWHVYFKHYKNPRELSLALAPIFNAEMKELVQAGAKYLQIEDLGAWLPLFTNDPNDYKWVAEVIAQCVDGVDAKIAWHFCFGNAWGNALSGIFPKGYETVLPYFYDVPIDQFVLDFANRDMADIACLKNLPKDKEVQVGVLDIRTMMV
jgi:5-methyltetrahydropteroyltriglutamate--homocysteine methyltransferase